MDESTKKCPYCAETIQAAATVCRYCRRDLGASEAVAALPQDAQPVALSDRGQLQPGMHLGNEPGSVSNEPFRFAPSHEDEMPALEPEPIKWLHVARDVVMVWAISFISGAIVGFSVTATGGNSSPDSLSYIACIAFANLISMLIGFCISGCLTKDRRFRHLALVAAFTWLTSILNVLFGASSLTQWASSSILILIIAMIGGGLALLFEKIKSLFS